MLYQAHFLQKVQYVTVLHAKIYKQRITHRGPKLSLRYLFTDLFRKESFLHSSEYLQGYSIKKRIMKKTIYYLLSM